MPRRHTAVFGALIASITLLAACSQGGGVDRDDPAVGIRTLLHGTAAPVLTVGTDTVHLSERTLSFYGSRSYEPAWTDDDGFTDRGAAFAGLLRDPSDGLDAAQHHGAMLEALLQRAEQEREADRPVGETLGGVDVLLTEAFLRYGSDLVHGTVDPTSAGLQWLIPGGDSTEAAHVITLLDAPDPAAALDSLRPGAPEYALLRAALSRYQKIVDAGGWPLVSEGDALEQGETNPRVAEIRNRLSAEGDPVEAPLIAAAQQPELYDSALANAVSHFQERHGIEPDGKIGKGTLAALNVPAQDRLLALKLNLDRWRWLPRDLGRRYVLVNVAGFDLTVVEDNRPVMNMNVVVGKEGWNTPFFQDTLEHVVLNPYWNVPPSIVKRDLVPALEKDPGYLARNGYEVVTNSGRRVDPYGVGVTSGDYTIRQRPGAKNALGQVKFVFPNSMNIYLHDTPARHLFKKTRRMYSSGCIRIEKPKELAEYLFANAMTESPGSYDSLVEGQRERWVKLDEPVPIYIVYFTAWADDQGGVSFYPDVYDRDSALEEVARAELEAPASTAADDRVAQNLDSPRR